MADPFFRMVECAVTSAPAEPLVLLRGRLSLLESHLCLPVLLLVPLWTASAAHCGDLPPHYRLLRIAPFASQHSGGLSTFLAGCLRAAGCAEDGKRTGLPGDNLFSAIAAACMPYPNLSGGLLGAAVVAVFRQGATPRDRKIFGALRAVGDAWRLRLTDRLAIRALSGQASAILRRLDLIALCAGVVSGLVLSGTPGFAPEARTARVAILLSAENVLHYDSAFLARVTTGLDLRGAKTLIADLLPESANPSWGVLVPSGAVRRSTERPFAFSACLLVGRELCGGSVSKVRGVMVQRVAILVAKNHSRRNWPNPRQGYQLSDLVIDPRGFRDADVVGAAWTDSVVADHL